MKIRFHASLLLAASTAVMMLLVSSACTQARKAEAGSGPEIEPLAVAVVRAVRGDIARKLTLSAEFKPYQEIEVMAKVSGYVRAIYVDVGDRVRQGQLLAELEVPEMADDLARTEAGLQRSTSEKERARDELQRAESAHNIAHLSYDRLAAVLKTRPGLVAQQEVDDVHSRDLMAEAQVSAARSSLAAAEQEILVSRAEKSKIQTMLNYTHVTAPFAGVVTRRYADTGSMIQAGTASQTQARPVVTLSENTLLRLILPVPESAVPGIRLGETIDVNVTTLGRTFPGRVARFARSVEMATRTMETEVDVPNADLVLVPGMYAEATLTLERHAGAIAVPATAVSSMEDKPWVLVVNADHRLERRKISLGMETTDRVEILAGVREGELVVLGDRSQMKPGQPVSAKEVEGGR